MNVLVEPFPEEIPFFLLAVRIPTMGRDTGMRPLATSPNRVWALSALFCCNFDNSKTPILACSDSRARSRVHSFNSGGILEWSISSIFTPLAAIFVRTSATAEFNASITKFLSEHFPAWLSISSSCLLFKTDSKSSSLIFTQSIFGRNRPRAECPPADFRAIPNLLPVLSVFLPPIRWLR